MDYVKLINCMRCGMCLPACPTYKETFLETASPRGRVALVRKLQEGELDQSERLLEYLSLCLDCQACASACPCGVNAGELVAEFTCERKAADRLSFMEDLVLRKLLPHPDRLEATMAPMRLYQRSGLQKLVRTLGILKMFPKPLERMEGLLPDLPEKPLRQVIQEDTLPAMGKKRATVGFFLGCVMSLVFSEASRATVRLLSLLGYRVITPRNQVCCGAPNMLAGDLAGLKTSARKNVDIFEEHEVDFIVTDCGGCGAELKKYGHHLADDSAVSFSGKVRDISQVLAMHAGELKLLLKPLPWKVTYHDPCHIAHCQGIRREPRDLLKLVPGLTYVELENADACCGSAGTYNIDKPEMADRILGRKLDTIRATGAQVLVTGNPGCLLQLKKGLMDQLPQVRIMHLTELLTRSIDA